MLLSDLLRALPEASLPTNLDPEIGGIAYNSRAVEPGSLFVAVPSVGGAPQTGGHRHLAEAVARGAVALVVQTGSESRAVTIRVPDTRSALGDLAARFYGDPAGRLSISAVTGTDGKTTTTYLLDQILTAAGFITGLIGTVEIKIGAERQPNLDRMTTPESLDVQRLLRRMVDAGVTHVSMEASSHALALQRLRGCRFAACGVTNITADHVEFHGSWEAYFAAKASLFSGIGRGAPAVLNRDDAHYQQLSSFVSGPLTTYGFHPDADVRATNVESTAWGSRFTLHAAGESISIHLPLPGRFNVSNALAAAALARTAGILPETIASALDRAVPPPGRMERVDAGQPFEVVVDYAHTMHAFETVLSSVRARTPAPHRLIAVFGATGDRDRRKRPELARIARRFADFFIITNEDPYRERPEAIIAEVASGLPTGDVGVRFICEGNRGRAIRQAIELAQPDDVVLILGKGHEQSMVVNGRKEPWSDVAAARAALESRT